MKNKKALTLTSVLVSSLIAIGIFVLLYQFILSNVQESGIEVDDTHIETYNNLINTENSISDISKDLKNNIGNISEAEYGYLAAINGFKGLGNVLLLFLKTLEIPYSVFQALIVSVSGLGIKKEIINIVGLIIIITMVLLIIAIMKGEQQKI